MDDLQFQKAEFSGDGPKCASCQAPIETEYYHLSGQVICPRCAERVRSGQQRPPNSAVLRGLMYGAGMAVACWAGYAAILAITGLEIGLIAIAVGYLVGRAVRTGSNGLGGLRVQLISVALTYLAITFAYIPVILGQAESWSILAIPIVAAMSLALPFLELFESPGSGILGLAIIAFGLLQAWRMAARDERLLMGPYQKEGEASASA